MSWFKRESPLRSSLRQKYSFTLQPKMPEGACLEVFAMHWQQAYNIIGKNDKKWQQVPPTADDVTSVINHMDQMITLLLQEAQPSTDLQVNGSSFSDFPNSRPILSFFLIEGCLDKLFNWSTHLGEFTNILRLKLEQLKYYEVLVTNCHQDLLFHKPIARPLLRLLSSCGDCAPVEVEKRLVILLNTLCVCITQFPDLLQVFFGENSSDGSMKPEKPEMFLIFSLLIPFVHREGAVGQQARDALLLCMALSQRNESIGMYIAEHSDFCPVLATGLSGLYSLLPRKFPVVSEDWHQFTAEDIAELPELAMFLNSLEFCNAVIQVAHPLVQEQLMEYLYQGFLVPVLGPALHQNSVDEIVTTTAYLELFLRTITEPILLQVFLKFILTSSCDGHRILNSLIDRLGAQSQLCLVTMALFKTLLDLNCEDVLFELVFRYLIPCSHIMVSQRSRVRDLDAYCLSADKFLSLLPASSVLDDSEAGPTLLPNQYSPVPSKSFNSGLSNLQSTPVLSKGGSLRIKGRRQRTPSTSSFAFGEFDGFKSYTIPSSLSMPLSDYETLPSSYMNYLQAAHKNVTSCTLACRNWSASYDGLDPPPDSMHNQRNEFFIVNKSEIPNKLKPQSTVNFQSASEKECNDKLIKQNKDSKLEYPSVNSKLNVMSDVKQKKINTSFEDNVILNKSSTQCSVVSNTEQCKDDVVWDILNQIVNTDDEKTFWKFVCSVETKGNCDSMDDSLETIFDFFNDAKDIENLENSTHNAQDGNFFCSDVSGIKEECSNPDSGVFESLDSYQSTKDGDSMPVDSAKSNKESLSISIPTSTTKSNSKSSSSPNSDPGSKSSNSPASPASWETFGTPNIGQFLSILLTRLEMMMQNDIYTNLHLTGLISRLACYPQPLLHSFLLNPLLVFQPTVRSLLQVLGSLKHKVDSYSYTIKNYEDLVNRSKQFLLAREEYLLPSSIYASPVSFPVFKQQGNAEFHRGEPRRRSLANFLFGRSGLIKYKEARAATFSHSREPTLESISDGQGYKYVNQKQSSESLLESDMESAKIKNAVLCSVVLEEFLKELAAIAQEHSVIQLNPDFWKENCAPWQ